MCPVKVVSIKNISLLIKVLKKIINGVLQQSTSSSLPPPLLLQSPALLINLLYDVNN